MCQFSQQGDFPDSRGWHSLFLTLQSDLLQGHCPVRLLVAPLVYNTISTYRQNEGLSTCSINVECNLHQILHALRLSIT